MEADGETEWLGLTLGELELDGETLALGLTDGELDDEGLTLAEGLTDADGETEALGLTDGEPTDDSKKATKMAAVSPVTAIVGLLVSPVEVLMRNSPLSSTALALLRLRVPVNSVKEVEGVSRVVEFASLPPAIR